MNLLCIKSTIVPFMSTIIGALISYGSIFLHDTRRDRRKKISELTSVSNLICFSLGMQLSEINNLKINVQTRMELLEKIDGVGETIDRDILVGIVQNFSLYKEVSIAMEESCKVLLSARTNKRGLPSSLQDVFISNKNYFKVMSMFEKYNEIKYLNSKDTKDTKEPSVHDLVRFMEINLPKYEEEINKTIIFLKRTLDSFKQTILENFGIKIKMSTGDTVKIS